MHQIAVIDVALCLALLLAGVPLLFQLCVCRNTLLFFILDEWSMKNLPHLCLFKMLRKGHPQNPKKRMDLPPPLDLLCYAAGIGVQN